MTTGRTLHTAEFLIQPGQPDPVRTGFGVLRDEPSGTVVAIAPSPQLRADADTVVDHQVLMPGVVNCHVHLTDSGIEQPVGGGEGLIPWLQDLLVSREQAQSDELFHQQVASVLQQMMGRGTVAIGEVTNDLRPLPAIVESGIRCQFMHELLGFPESRAQQSFRSTLAGPQLDDLPATISYTVAAHAPYSVSLALMKLIHQRNNQHGTFTYQHIAEDSAERRLYEEAAGPWREFLERIGGWEPTWQAFGISPIQFYDRMGLIDGSYVGVHLTDATEPEIALLASRGARGILSPASNLHITGNLPNVMGMVQHGLKFGLGTDGRGSNPSIDVFDEAKILLENFPELPPGRLLEAMTVHGAEILQFNNLGAITVGEVSPMVSARVGGSPNDLRSLERAVVMEWVERRGVR